MLSVDCSSTCDDLVLNDGPRKALLRFFTLADPNNTILVGTYVCSCSHGCGEGQRTGKGIYMLGSVTGVKCHDLLGAYRTSKPHVTQIIKGRCVGSQHTFVLPSQLVCLRGTREESQNSFERNPCNWPIVFNHPHRRLALDERRKKAKW